MFMIVILEYKQTLKRNSISSEVINATLNCISFKIKCFRICGKPAAQVKPQEPNLHTQDGWRRFGILPGTKPAPLAGSRQPASSSSGGTAEAASALALSRHGRASAGLLQPQS
jgi:hypothetical protein